jgi:glycosyltransferase involved in cell wall biosynthesis
MPQTRIHILFPFQSGPWGGANQFLRALHSEWKSKGYIAPSLREANVVLLNANTGTVKTQLSVMRQLHHVHPETLVILRLDGPVQLYRQTSGLTDQIFYSLARNYADAIIFQSQWSKKQNLSLGLSEPAYSQTIINAPDGNLFYRGACKLAPKRIKCIATSWSANPAKGFDVYSWLDEHLDFSRYSMTFVGNSPVSFKNIQHISPQPSDKLAEILREHDVFITASRRDPCSNSLIEALHCGLPAIGFRDGGHPELIGDAGELFDAPQEIPQLLERISENYDTYRRAINLPSIEETAGCYLSFIQQVLNEKALGYAPKNPNILQKGETLITMCRYFSGVKLNNLIDRFK